MRKLDKTLKIIIMIVLVFTSIIVSNPKSYAASASISCASSIETNKPLVISVTGTGVQWHLVLKVNGNLIINEGVTLTACKSDDGYGGPKGMTIYCTGTLTNNGTISMTARGAKAEGEDVYLWKNTDNTYEFVPAAGGAGGIIATSTSTGGRPGSSGTGRATGGGGSGAVGQWRNPSTGSGAAGTSYSGGSGGGGMDANNNSNGNAKSNGRTRRKWL
mgnify:CR=1 FL=1